MTVIAGASDGRRVWLAADSQATSGTLAVRMTASAKLRAVGRGVILGTSGPMGPCQLLEVGVEWPRLTGDRGRDERSLVTWWQATVLPAAESWTDSASSPGEDSRVPSAGVDVGDVGALLAVRGTLWELVQGAWIPIDYGAVGSGCVAALAVLTDRVDMPAEHRVQRAVEVACELDAMCSLPLTVEST